MLSEVRFFVCFLFAFVRVCACACACACVCAFCSATSAELHAVVAKTPIDDSTIPWLQSRVRDLLDTELTGVPSAWKLNVAKVFSSLPYYYRAAYDTKDVVRGHVLAGMVHNDGRDGNDFKACLHTTKAKVTKQYEDMCYSVRDEHLRYAYGEGGGRVPDWTPAKTALGTSTGAKASLWVARQTAWWSCVRTSAKTPSRHSVQYCSLTRCASRRSGWRRRSCWRASRCGSTRPS